MSEPLPPLPDESTHGSLRQLVRDLLSLDRRALTILVSVPILLTLLDYFGMPWHYQRYVNENPAYTTRRLFYLSPRADPPGIELIRGLKLPGPEPLHQWIWWGIACLLLLVILPTIVAAFTRLSPRDIGLRIKGTGRDALTYLFLFLLIFPVVWLVSRQPEFQRTYPFIRSITGPTDPTFIAFHAIYCLQFFAIEYFFRGFMVLGLKPSLGKASVLVMLAPYCMIHYYKPMPEALGAIAAGLVLGMLSWRTRTIIYGWFLHYAVALSMDLLALSQTPQP